MPITSIDVVQGFEDVDLELGLAPQLPYTHGNDLVCVPITPIYSTSPSAPISRSSGYHLQRVLGEYDLLSTIASECHFHDMWNLMLVSRGIRSAILDATAQRSLWKKSLCSDPSDQHPQNQFYPANPPTDCEFQGRLIRCFSCGSPVCKRCEATSELLQAETIRHLLDCRPCCGECFRGKHCFLPRKGKSDVNPEMMLPGKCDCGLGHLKPKPPPTEIDQDYMAMMLEGDRTACYAGSASIGDPTLVAPVKV